jgi:putative hemolysin
MNINHIIKALTERNRQQPPPAGMVGAAAANLADRGYQLHVQDAKSQGAEPLDYATWQAQQSRPQQR